MAAGNCAERSHGEARYYSLKYRYGGTLRCGRSDSDVRPNTDCYGGGSGVDAQILMYVQTRTVMGGSGVDAQIVMYVQTRTVMGGGSGVDAQILMYVQTRTVMGGSGVDAQIVMYVQTRTVMGGAQVWTLRY